MHFLTFVAGKMKDSFLPFVRNSVGKEVRYNV